MSLESEMVDEGLVMEAGLTNEDMAIELRLVNQGSVMVAWLTCHLS